MSLLFSLFLISAVLLIAIGVYGIVVTRNLKHFQPLGVTCLNPWSDNPSQSP